MLAVVSGAEMLAGFLRNLRRLACASSHALPLVLALAAVAAGGQRVCAAELIKTDAEKALLNASRVGLATGSPTGAYAAMGADLATLLDDHKGLGMRVVVQLGRGSLGNVDDLLNLALVDFALVQGDVLESFRSDPAKYAELKRKMRFVTQLHKEQVHLLARSDIRQAKELNGLAVSVGAPGGGSVITAHNIFGRLGITPVYVETSPQQALPDLLAGKIDAILFVVGKPTSTFQAIKADDVLLKKLHFVPLGGPEFTDYVVTQLVHDDYPNLIDQDVSVQSLAVPSVLAVFNWEPQAGRYGPVKKFIERFFENANLLDAAGFRRDKWCEVDLAGDVPGWQRSPIAASWLALHPQRAGPICGKKSDDTCEAKFLEAMKRAGFDVSQMAKPVRDSNFANWRKSNSC